MCGGDHTREQLINWVMSKDGIATCFIKDVLSMSESKHGGGARFPNCTLVAFNLFELLRATGLPYYLLGRVPCRSVSLVAIVVGAVAYEHRILYSCEYYYLSLHHT
jgi:hypothetical protein